MSGQGYDYARLTALVVDEDPFFRRLVAQMLQQIGLAAVSQASEVVQAMAEFELIVPDLVFCAVQMRPLDGLQFLRSVRQLSDPHLAATPIVLLASEVEHGAVPLRLDYHVSGYLAKPFSTVQLNNRIDAVIAANPLLSYRLTGFAAGELARQRRRR